MHAVNFVRESVVVRAGRGAVPRESALAADPRARRGPSARVRPGALAVEPLDVLREPLPQVRVADAGVDGHDFI